MPWASPSFDACNSWIFLGVTRVASPSLSFSPSFISLLIPSIHLKIFLHTKLHTIFISNISALKIIGLLGLVLTPIKLPLKHKLLYHFPQKAQFPKRTQKGTNKKQMQKMAEICQNRPAGKDKFFQRPSVAQIKKC